MLEATDVHETPAERAYRDLQARFTLSVTGDYERLVTASGNSQMPVHRWFHVKEAYSHALLSRVIKDTGLDSTRRRLTIHDPFAGSGTTVASAGDYAASGGCDEVHVTATEVNPFLHLLASLKARAFTEQRPDALRVAKRIVASASRGAILPAAPPALSTFGKPDYISPEHVEALQLLRAGIENEASLGLDKAAVDVLQLCLAASVEPSSRLRRDGRALRYEASKVTEHPFRLFLDRAYEIHADWSQTANFSAAVQRADAREAIETDRVDLVLFSPPYPNNIDYTEVYKLENWQLGLIASQEDFRLQRLRTLRSHPSVKFADAYSFDSTPQSAEVRSLLEPICRSIPESRYRAGLARTVLGYADDMLKVLTASAARLRPGGHLVCVVGNSLHGAAGGGVVVAADLIIAAMAEFAGLEVTQIEVARVPTRRRTTSQFLRESVVFARKGNT